MILRGFTKSAVMSLALAVAGGAIEANAASCVWKVTAPSGQTLFLGGSIHALRTSDYPLPAAYDRAMDASSQLVIEADPKAVKAAAQGLFHEGQYPKGDSLKNHVDPRTYEYVRKFFALEHVPEEKFSHYRPWLINVILESPPAENSGLGVEEYLKHRAGRKPISGLETTQEHMAPFVGLTDRQSEALLLVFFINLGRHESGGRDKIVSAWRHGDVDTIAAELHEIYQDFPAFGERLLTARNRRWIPKIEEYLKSGKTVFVVAGAAHFGGNEGVLALLKGRGYKIEQL